ncbi:MAG: 50S ribosomal protein L3 [Candidatus Parcubacteria bacterium]|nr:MAG: 50S ribosomal protein L3 [Candidatus Parcubacteria bacterium]
MIKFILGKKLSMITYFKDYKALPATVISVMKCKIKNILTEDKEGYNAIKLECYDERGKKYLKEFRIPKDLIGNFKVDDSIDINIFENSDKLSVTGISKGKGFQGVVKRWGFRDAPRTHGQTTKYRHPGSIGPTTPQRVRKGLKMAGRMGNQRVVVKNLEVLDIDKENNLLIVKGSVPGNRKSVLEIRNKELTRKGKLVKK